MADNYLQFSEILQLESDEEKAWVEGELAEDTEFSWTIDDNLELWMYAEEFGNTDHAAEFLQNFLLKFHPDRCFHITFAETCSKPRVGEFGGGAIFVTSDGIEWFNTHDWVKQVQEEFEDSK